MNTNSSLNVQSVRNLLKYGGVSITSIADKIRAPIDTLEAYRDGTLAPDEKVADSIADAFDINKYALYTKEDFKPDNHVIDFRTLDNKPAQISLKGKKAISHAMRLLKLAAFAGAAAPDLPEIEVDIRKARETAKRLRTHLGITDSIQIAQTSRKDFFRLLRRRIELKNIFVWSASVEIEDFRGACLNYGGIWAIVFNTKDENHGARSFTLAHELAHVCVGTSGISDPYRINNDLERFCNKVAAIMLAPENLLIQVDERHHFGDEEPIAYVRYFANQLNLSQYMIAIRLMEIGLIDGKYFEKWLRLYKVKPNFVEYGDGSGAGSVERDEGKNKIAKFGALLPIVIISAVENKKLSSIEAQMHMSLKRRYFDETRRAAEEFLEAA